MRCMTRLGPLDGGGVGQLHVDQQIALVLHGNEARGARVKPQYVSVSRPP